MTAWHAALRIARREAWRAKGRSLLVIALIGLPVFVLADADVAYRTWQLSPSEKVVRQIGAADAGIQWYGGGQVLQTPTAWLGSVGSDGATTPRAAPSPAELRADLPAGTRMIERHESAAQIRTRAGLKYAQLIGLDYADPIAAGLVDQVSGRAPRTAGEVALTGSLAASVGLRVGDTMHLIGPARELTVVGIVRQAGHRDGQAAYTLPSAIGADRPGYLLDDTWLVHTPAPVDWAQVRRLNGLGYLVLSRSAYLHPPPASQIPKIDSGPLLSTDAVATAALVVGMALLEVVLLAGPAFAVGARRQRRQLALIAATGGRRADLRNVVLAHGVVLGLAAGVVGVLAGIGAAAVAVPTLGRLVDAVPGHFDVRPPELAGLVAVSLVTALLAALFPARAAARTDVVAALGGRRGATRTRKRVPVLGAAVAAAGAAVAIGGAAVATGWAVILAGVVLVELGLIVCTPALLGLLARLGRVLPLSGRIALRDAGRNRSAAAPAVAAVMASVIGAVSIAVGVASSVDQDRRNYRPALPAHDAWVRLDPGQAGQASRIAAALRTTLPARRTVTVRGPNNVCTATQQDCVITDVELQPPAGVSRQVVSSRYRGGQLPTAVVDDGSGVGALFGVPEPAAVAALRVGKAVVVDRSALSRGTVRLTATVTDGAGQPAGSGSTAAPATPTSHTLTVAAVAVENGYPATQVIVPPALADRLGVVAIPLGVLVQTTRAPTDREEQAANAALHKIDSSLGLYVESGYHNPDSWLTLALVGAAAAIAIAAAVIAPALANVDARPDLVTLGAVGASPRTRRLLSAARAAVIAGSGTVIGVVAGFVPPIAWVHASHRVASYTGNAGSYFSYDGQIGPQLRLVVPWLAVASALVGIPLVAALIAGLFTRSRLPSERRPE